MWIFLHKFHTIQYNKVFQLKQCVPHIGVAKILPSTRSKFDTVFPSFPIRFTRVPILLHIFG